MIPFTLPNESTFIPDVSTMKLTSLRLAFFGYILISILVVSPTFITSFSIDAVYESTLIKLESSSVAVSGTDTLLVFVVVVFLITLSLTLFPSSS